MSHNRPRFPMKQLTAIAVLLLALILFAGAQPAAAAEVNIEFNGLPQGSGAFPSPYQEGGFTMTSADLAYSNVLPGTFPAYVVPFQGPNSGTLEITETDTSAFEFISLVMATEGTSADPISLTLTGYSGASVVGTELFQMNQSATPITFSASNLAGKSIDRLSILFTGTSNMEPALQSIRLENAPCPAFPVSVGTESELNQAIGCFNAIATPGTYTINVTQDISLTSSITRINNPTSGVDLVIAGGNHTIDGGFTTTTPGNVGFSIRSRTAVTMSDLTVSRCQTLLTGAAIHNVGGGALTLNNVALTYNVAGFGGAGLNTTGPATITNSLIAHNLNDGTGGGGGILVESPGSVTLINSEVSDNSSVSRGGGIRVQPGASLTVTGSTIARNDADEGSAIFSEGTLTMRNSTVSGNTASTSSVRGGAVYISSGSGALDSVTVANNSVPNNPLGVSGVVFADGTTGSVNNTIVDAPEFTTDFYCVGGAAVTFNRNLFGQIGDAGIGSSCDAQTGNIVGQSANLGPLADNGGPTWTHLPNAGSPVIDAGDTTLTADQRGIARPQGAADDIGAVEVPLGRIFIQKQATSDQEIFEFSQNIDTTGNFFLTSGASQLFLDVLPGQYTVTELDPSTVGYELAGLTCSDDDSTVDIPNLAATINLAPGETVTCTFVNVEQALQDTILIMKLTEPADTSGSTSFDFELSENGGQAQPFSLKHGEITDFTVAPNGSYTITENESASDDYLLRDIVCFGGGSPQFSGSSVTLTFGAAGNEAALCIFVNTQLANLTVVKEAIPADGTEFPFEVYNDSENALIDDFSLQDGEDNLIEGVFPASFRIKELGVSGWDLTNVACELANGTPKLSYTVGLGEILVEVEPGEDVTCTFTNAKQAPPDACPVVVGNLIQNYCFEEGTGPWIFFTDGAGAYTTSSSNPYQGQFAADVQIQREGSNVQLYQKDLPLKPNTLYELSFAAYSSNANDLSVFVHKHGTPYTNYGLKNFKVNLQPGWKLYQTTFTTTGFTAPVNDARLRFWLAPFDINNMAYHIDWVVLREVDSGNPPIPPDPPVVVPPPGQCTPNPNNMIANPGFESGTSSWTFFTDGAGSFTTATADPYECASNAVVSISQSGDNVQLYQQPITLQGGQTYRLRMAARSNNGRDVRLYMHQHGAPYTNYGLNGVQLDLTPAWQVFVVEFTARGSVELDDARLRIWMAPFDVSGTVYEFDDVVLEPVSAAQSSLGIIPSKSILDMATALNRQAAAWVPASSVQVQGFFIDGDETGRLSGGYVPQNGKALCYQARPSVATLLPANGKMARVNILGLGGPQKVTITGITQDELTGPAPDARYQGGTAWLRRERDGQGDGRVYSITFDAAYKKGPVCSYEITVTVPLDRKTEAVDSGANFNATKKSP